MTAILLCNKPIPEDAKPRIRQKIDKSQLFAVDCTVCNEGRRTVSEFNRAKLRFRTNLVNYCLVI